MSRFKMLTFWSIIAAITIFIYGCPKNCLDATYSFSVAVQYTPDKDSIQVGDTIFLSSSFPTQVKDQFTGRTIDYSGLKNNIGTDLIVREFLHSQEFIRDAVFDFEYVNFKGQIYNYRNIASPDAVQQIRFEEAEGKYQIKFGLIPKKVGVYTFSIGNGLGLSKKCTSAQLSLSVANSNQHLSYINLFKPDWQTTEYERQHNYYIKVY